MVIVAVIKIAFNVTLPPLIHFPRFRQVSITNYTLKLIVKLLSLGNWLRNYSKYNYTIVKWTLKSITAFHNVKVRFISWNFWWQIYFIQWARSSTVLNMYKNSNKFITEINLNWIDGLFITHNPFSSLTILTKMLH